jgi:soluble lytic murein transglycosylase-like protein
MVPKWHSGVDFERVKKDPDYAIGEGARYFRELLDMYKGDYQKAAAAYNWGPTRLTNLLKNKDKAANWKEYLPEETKKYLKSVFG